MNEKVKSNKMAFEKEFNILFKMSLPAIFSMFVNAIYNVADSYFVAQVSEKALRSVSMAMSIQLIITAISVGTSIGVNSFMARRLGEGDSKKAGEGVVNGAFLIFISWVVFFLFSNIFLDSYYHLFTNDQEVINLGKDYLSIVTSYSVFLFFLIFGEKVLQATGSMVIPMISHLISSVLNIIVDPILIHGKYGFPAMSTKGAAISTVFSQFVGFSFLLIYIIIKRKNLGIDIKGAKLNSHTIKKIYEVGFPSMLQTSISAILNFFMNMILSGINEISVSVMNVYTQLQSFIFMPVLGLGQGYLPLVAYNFGAKLKDRVLNLCKIGLKVGIIFGIFGFLLMQFFGINLFIIFNEEPEFLEIASVASRIMAFNMLFAPVSIIYSNYFQALGNGKYSLSVSIIRQLIIILPLAVILSKISLNAVWFSFPIAECIALLISLYLVRKINNKKVNALSFNKIK